MNAPLSRDLAPSHDGNAETIRPGRLWSSLWDMLELNARAFYGAVNAMNNLENAASQGETVRERADGTIDVEFITDDQARGIVEVVEALANELRILGTPISLMEVDRLIEQAKYNAMTWNDLLSATLQIKSRLSDELKLTKVLVIEREKLKYFSPSTPLFGAEFDSKFRKDGVFELDESAKCIALGRPTAAVFHLMRTMEVGIRTTARCLGIPDPTKGGDRNWGNILRDIKKDMDSHAGPAPSKAWNVAHDREFFESAYASLDAVRVAWRNTTMHVEKKYTDDEAEHIFSAVKGFMKGLASRMDEDGLPLA